MVKKLEKLTEGFLIGAFVISTAIGGYYVFDKIKERTKEYLPKIEQEIVSYYMKKR